MKRTHTEITIEVEEMIHAVDRRDRFLRGWCSSCGSEALMVAPDQAAAIARVSVRAVNQSVEAGRVHFLETPDGRLLVCVKSLSCASSARLLPPTQQEESLEEAS